jgi:hypothetical protein
VCEVLFLLLMIFIQVLKKCLIKVCHRRRVKSQKHRLSRIQQQLEFMFGKLTRIQKLETRSDGGRSKKG